MADPATPETPPSTPPRSAVPPVSTAQSIADQYDLAPEEASAAVVPPGPPVASSPDVPAASSPRERDLVTGQFLPKTATHEHSAYLVRMAQDLGLAPEEIAGTSPEVLSQTVYHLTRQLQGMARERSIEATHHAAAGPSGQRVDPASPPAPEEQYDLGLDEAQYDPGLLGVLRRLVKEHRELKAFVQQREQARDNQAVLSRVDKLFSEHPTVYGAGATESLPPDGPEFARRQAIFANFQRLLGAKKHTTLEKDFATSHSLLFGAVPAKPAAPTVGVDSSKGPTPEEWAAAGLARPTHRANSTEPPSREKAIKGIEQFERENGTSERPASADEFPE